MRAGIVLLTVIWCLNLQAQPFAKQTTHQNLIWFAYFNKIELNSKWFVGSEIHERRFAFPDKQHQLLFRSHLHYRLDPGWDISAGFTYFLQSPHDPYLESTFMVPELRPHIQLSGTQNFNPRWRVDHRYLLEKRFYRNYEDDKLVSGYTSNFRMRYRLTLSWLLSREDRRALTLKLSDEIHFNFGNEILYNHFDQNRIYVGINYNLSAQMNMEVGYMNWYQQRQTGNQFYNRNIIRVNLIHRIKFKNNHPA